MKYIPVRIIIFLLLNIYLSGNTNIKNGFDTPINIWNINSKEDDFAPYFMEDYLIFNSIVNGYSKYFTALIDSKTDTNIIFKLPAILKSPLNQNKKNNAYFCLIDNKEALVNGHTMFKNGNFVNIKKSNFERNTWTEPNIIAELSEDIFMGHPTISSSKNILIFSSNKNSPNKTTDLWSATLQSDGTWDMFIPIDELNSIGNEITPFFVNDTTLIFASDGFDGKGGYDLFYSYYVDGTWTKPVPLEDINTEFNESDPLIIFDYLVFASDRPGGRGGLDLYYAKIKDNDTTENITNPLSVSATNYQLNITRNIEYNLVSNAVKNVLNIIDDTSYISTPSIIEFKIHKNLPTNENIFYKLHCEDNILEKDVITNDSAVIIGFGKYAPKIFLLDSCYFEIAYKNFNNVTIPIEIIKNESKVPKIYSENNDTFFKVFAKNTDNIKSFEELNQDIISNLKELAITSKKIEIIANSEKIYNELSKIFSQKNTTFVKTTNADVVEFLLYNY